MMVDQNDDAGLEDLFAQARQSPPLPSEALLARVVAEGLAEQSAPRGGWRLWLGALGGVPGLAGLATAACVGVWLGFAPPDGVPDIAGGLLGEVLVSDGAELSPGLSGFGWDLEEG